MLIDARTLPPGARVEADVCIVGAGPTGIVLGIELAGSGRQVCILESGGEKPGRGPGEVASGESVGHPYYPLKRASMRAFGGSSRHWGSGSGDFWHARPLDELDFEERAGVPHSGWPFARSRLVPFYQRAEAFCELQPFAYSTAPGGATSAHALFGDGPIRTDYLQVTRSTFTRHLGRLAGAANIRLVLHAQVAEILTENRPGDVVGVRVMSAPRRQFSVRARVYVLAAGGIENARLLLLSRLGNEHDLVGRYFMEHVGVRSGAVVPSDRRLLAETSLYAHRDQGGVRPTLRLDEAVVRAQGLLNAAFLLEPRPRAFASDALRSLSTLYRALTYQPRPPHLAAHTRSVIVHIGDVARTARARVRPAVAGILVLRVQAEQAPNPDSRVTLSTRRDPFGLPQPRLDWRLSELDQRSIRTAQHIIDRELRRAELGRLIDALGEERPPALLVGLHHHLGTTRMHPDPRRGVVDANGRLHSCSNLFISGGSVFPTGGWANPTLTIVALAVRLADHVKAVLARS